MTSARRQPDRDQLKPEDFPLRADKEKITRQDGKPIAETEDGEMAKEIAGRLNSDAHHREEDRWSA